jgi:hypothetical protein
MIQKCLNVSLYALLVDFTLYATGQDVAFQFLAHVIFAEREYYIEQVSINASGMIQTGSNSKNVYRYLIAPC